MTPSNVEKVSRVSKEIEYNNNIKPRSEQVISKTTANIDIGNRTPSSRELNNSDKKLLATS